MKLSSVLKITNIGCDTTNWSENHHKIVDYEQTSYPVKKLSWQYSSKASEISKAAKSFSCPASSSYAKRYRAIWMMCFPETIFATIKTMSFSTIQNTLNTLLTFWQLFYVRYLQLQNRCLAFKKKLNWRTRPEERISANPDWTSSTQPLQRNTWLKTGSHHTKTWTENSTALPPPPPPQILISWLLLPQ